MKRTLPYLAALLLALVLGSGTSFGHGFIGGDEDVLVYPNPATNALNIRLENSDDYISHISLHNLIGQLVYEADIDITITDSYIVEITDLPSGIYILNVELTQGRTFSQRITKR
jgi:hypothetical protein